MTTALTDASPIAISGDTAHYLATVLRLRTGSHFLAVDPAGREAEVVLEACVAGEVRGQVVRLHEAEATPRPALVLYLALLKNRNFELVLQKCTELGVAAFVPMMTERTVPRPPGERLVGRGERWAKIVAEACRQCGRTRPPPVGAPVGWQEALRQFGESGATGLIPYEGLARHGCHSLHEALSVARRAESVAVFIGPEGGFAPGEISEARSAGLVPVSLGPLILRAETAAIAACTAVMYELADW